MSQKSSIVQRDCWCGSATARLLHTFELDGGQRFPMVRCEGCGVDALHPQPTDAQLSAAYASDYYGVSPRKFIWPISMIVSHFQAQRARMAARLLQPGAKILDVGCGNGGFLIQLKKRGFEVQGTEWTLQSAVRVPHRESIHVHVGELTSLHLPEHSFDMITLWHVFEHLRDPAETLREIARLLKPSSGHVLMAMPNAQSMQARRFGRHWFHHDPPRHLFGFGPQSLSRLLDEAGFELVSVSTHSLEQNPFGFIQSSLNAAGHPRDRLYSNLKGLRCDSFAIRMLDRLRAGVLLAPALAFSIAESMRGCGATMTVHARISSSVPQSHTRT